MLNATAGCAKWIRTAKASFLCTKKILVFPVIERNPFAPTSVALNEHYLYYSRRLTDKWLSMTVSIM